MRHLCLPVHFVLFLSLLVVTGQGTAKGTEGKPTASSHPPIAKNTDGTSKKRSGPEDQEAQGTKNPAPSFWQPVVDPTVNGGERVGSKEAKERQQDRMWPPSAAWAAVLVAGISAFATIAYVVVSFGQWRAIRRQSEIASEGIAVSKIAANAARDSANVARDSLRISERAWLSVTFDRPFWPSAEQVNLVEFTVRNIGKTVAKLKARSIKGVFWPHPFIPERALEAKPVEALPTIATIFPGATLVLDGLVDITFTKTQINGIRNGSQLFDVYGYVAYEDVFGERHITRFCQVYDVTHNEGRGGFTYPREAKTEYNDAD